MSTRVTVIIAAIFLGAVPEARALSTTNGITTNGITTNGITTNGITTNGITTNGITTNGITTNGITTNGITTNGITTNGITTNGITTNGITTNGITTNGITTNGITTNGITTNGITTNGITTNGITTNGITTNGITTNGITTNGITTNGITTNGITTNGITTNGITTNGITTNGLAPGAGSSGLAELGLSPAGVASPAFAAWFARDPAYAAMVIKYVTECALPAGASLSFNQAGKTYAWSGVFGLAPTWSAGAAIPASEQELVSACLAAHTNPQGQHVRISVRGYQADGSAIPVTADEAADYRFREAAFFGNLFDGSGVFVAPERDVLDPSVSTRRGCAAERGVPGSCGPMVQAGVAAERCTAGADGATYGACTVNGRAFRPVQVFLRDSDVTRVR